MKIPKYAIKDTDEHYELCKEININEIKDKIVKYAEQTGYAFLYPDNMPRLSDWKNKNNENKHKRLDTFNKFVIILGLDIVGFSNTKQFYIMKMAMDELIEEGRMFKRKQYKIYVGKKARGGYIYSFNNKKGESLNSIFWLYANKWEYLQTFEEKLNKIYDNYKEDDGFVADKIFPIGRDKEICYYMKKSNDNDNDNLYKTFSPLYYVIELLNMKGFVNFKISTKVNGYKSGASKFNEIGKEMDNKVQVGSKIYAIDFVIEVCG